MTTDPDPESTPGLVRYLFDLASSRTSSRPLVAPSGSALAQLRRSMSYPNGIAPDAIPHLVHFTHPNDPREREHYLLAALFALWHTSNPPVRPGKRLGSALKQLAASERTRADTLMARLVSAPREYVAVPARGAITALAAARIPLNWTGLYFDLCRSAEWDKTQRWWATQYWG
ncbi:type I-E CRISPR-associated protein Cse2/CasB [Frankia sp. Ag45/Mut15]|uniref:Type I-E CRISPR-associated protein Cse2/CasB n=1 Tax=Frankia umida TaxID=573489 RepID=A0ABT0K3E9_9ACTN|nr:type I-E CRISPR-associated protein Cse2/CasB [Frankia umida]MCK9878257.1 type I-E CRISPR-associated protein Cse2/CasB [Frankia umida]